jgi:predicted PurR-regulated permease PerM
MGRRWWPSGWGLLRVISLPDVSRQQAETNGPGAKDGEPAASHRAGDTESVPPATEVADATREHAVPTAPQPEGSATAATPGSEDSAAVAAREHEPLPDVAVAAAKAARETEELVQRQVEDAATDPQVTRPGAPFNRRSPFYVGFMAALGVLIAYGLMQMVLQLSQIFTFIVLALFLSLGLEPIVAMLERRRVRRGYAVLIVVVGVAGIFSLIGWLIVPMIVSQATNVVEQAPSYLTHLRHNHFVQDVNARWHITDRLQQDIQNNIDQSTFSTVFGGVLGAGKVLVDSVVATFVVLVLTLYFLAAMPRIKAAAYKLVPHSRRPRVVYLSEEITRRVGAYVLGQLFIAAINGAFSFVILFVLGLPFPALLATLVAMLALVPIVGTLIGGVIVTLVALTSGWLVAVIVLSYYVAYHLFEAYVLGPRIMNRVVEVPAVVTIVAILAGGTLLGILGALIAIPVAAGLLIIYDQVLVPRQQRA